MVRNRQGQSGYRTGCIAGQVFRLLQCDRPAIRVDGLLRDQRLCAEELHMD